MNPSPNLLERARDVCSKQQVAAHAAHELLGAIAEEMFRNGPRDARWYPIAEQEFCAAIAELDMYLARVGTLVRNHATSLALILVTLEPHRREGLKKRLLAAAELGQANARTACPCAACAKDRTAATAALEAILKLARGGGHEAHPGL